VHRINKALSEGSVERRLVAMEEQLKALSNKLSATGRPSTQRSPQRAQGGSASARTSASVKGSVAAKKPAPKRTAPKRTAPKRTAPKRAAPKGSAKPKKTS
jgi:hypothetical protein